MKQVIVRTRLCNLMEIYCTTTSNGFTCINSLSRCVISINGFNAFIIYCSKRKVINSFRTVTNLESDGLCLFSACTIFCIIYNNFSLFGDEVCRFCPIGSDVMFLLYSRIYFLFSSHLGLLINFKLSQNKALRSIFTQSSTGVAKPPSFV